ncbi:glutamate--tRNA ligase, mitochondrial [[Candida] railenensis]|uniref:Glutamate--tRNA ligase, mitochondrial n=1 Tax=[Candida] railenensis TaxID=45579 RepID=A0A9P0QKT3_9ASCO|nr:glutamate--tRNA ligase, mitochondrial [[Candida] railenensis]
MFRSNKTSGSPIRGFIKFGSFARWYASIHPKTPARTRFAPSPTGVLHLGSLRTALYNYLLAKSTGGSFILRLEDTDQKRLIEGAEQNIYESLKWCNINIDEGPESDKETAPFAPYRQSDRKEIYQKYVQVLLDSGHAYKCFCSKDRLDSLRQSAMKLKPPTTVTYDRSCLDGEKVHTENDHYVIRFKSPEVYPPFVDLTHGTLDLQPQVNLLDRRYDDFVIMKSDGLPTYHFANIVDDHLMQITHVIRGEEWLSSTPKHIALYKAFGWEPPSFIHIPLLTSLSDKKLSKRSGDMGVLSLRDEQGILPEALVNFVALFGWSPPRLHAGVSTSEVMSLEELIQSFSLDNLTKGNAKVTEEKLKYFNKMHLQKRIQNPQELVKLVNQELPKYPSNVSADYLKVCFEKARPSINNLNDLRSSHSYLFERVDLAQANKDKLSPNARDIIQKFSNEYSSTSESSEFNFQEVVRSMGYPQKEVFMSLRFALSCGKPGLTIPVIIEILGREESLARFINALAVL